MRRRLVSLLPVFALVAAGGFAVQCGGAVCGNGAKEAGEQCDNGPANGSVGNGCSAQCKLVSIPVASIQVVYQRLAQEAPGYTGASSSSLGVDHAHIRVEGPAQRTLDEFLRAELGDGIAPGDMLESGPLRFIVREVVDGRVETVGLAIEAGDG